MTKYIDKSALAAELEKRIKETESMQPKFDQFWAGQISAFKGVLKILDTFEEKEVDLDELLSNLDKDIKEFVTTEEFEKDSAMYGHYWAIAKHSFELGLKAKGK